VLGCRSSRANNEIERLADLKKTCIGNKKRGPYGPLFFSKMGQHSIEGCCLFNQQKADAYPLSIEEKSCLKDKNI